MEGKIAERNPGKLLDVEYAEFIIVDREKGFDHFGETGNRRNVTCQNKTKFPEQAEITMFLMKSVQGKNPLYILPEIFLRKGSREFMAGSAKV